VRRAPATTPYLLEALIAAEHALAPTAVATAWPRIVGLYTELEEVTGSPVVRLNRAVAVAEVEGAAAGLELLAGLELPDSHRLPAVRAELLLRTGRREAAVASFTEAVARCGNETERRFLLERLAVAGG
jgi:RNA polymerase sigma-70 factor (ECF subfamily)